MDSPSSVTFRSIHLLTRLASSWKHISSTVKCSNLWSSSGLPTPLVRVTQVDRWFCPGFKWSLIFLLQQVAISSMYCFFFFSEYFDVSILFKVLEPNVNFLSYSYIPFFFSCFSNLHFPYLQSNNPSFNSGSSWSLHEAACNIYENCSEKA